MSRSHEEDAAESADVARLRRWVDSGGTWALAARRPGWVLVSLLRCDGGEEADRFASSDPRLIELVEDDAVTE